MMKAKTLFFHSENCSVTSCQVFGLDFDSFQYPKKMQQNSDPLASATVAGLERRMFVPVGKVGDRLRPIRLRPMVRITLFTGA